MTITGGGRLRRILANSRGLTGNVLARIVADVLRRVLLPEVRNRLPRRTGRLARSLIIRQRGDAVELRAVFYGNLVRVPGAGSVAALAMDVLEAQKGNIDAAIERGIRSHLGI